ncbi:MAG: hypothetical protein OXU79_08590 [Gemmatimonadota bacterium]|nr:hypothetical protein [Gemmatimonadota bacterium]
MPSVTPPGEADFDARHSRLEGIAEQLSERMSSIETRMDAGFRDVHRRMDAGFLDVQRRIDAGFRWMIGIQITTLIALGTLILVKL